MIVWMNNSRRLLKIGFLLILLLYVVSKSVFPQYISTAQVGDWNSAASWQGGNIAPSPQSNYNDVVDIYGRITLKNSNYALRTFLGNATLTVYDTLIIEGDLNIEAASDIRIEPGAVLVVYGDFNMTGFIIWGGDGSNAGDIVVTGDLNVANQSNFDTQNGNTYVDGNITDPGGNITGTVDPIDSLINNEDLNDLVHSQCNSPVSITLNSTNASALPGSNATITYTGTTGSPDIYQINFDAMAEAEGFTDIAFTNIPASLFSIAVPAGATPGTYNAVLTLRNSGSSCIGTDYEINITAQDAQPAINLISTNLSLCSQITSINLAYSATTNSPDQYSIDFDAAAELQGFTDVNNAALPASPIKIMVPTGANAATYNANLTVRNSSSSQVSNNYAISIEILALPSPSIAIDVTSEYSDSDCFNSGNILVLNVSNFNTYSWSINPTLNDSGEALLETNDGTNTVSFSNFSNINTTNKSYTINITVSDANSCAGADTFNFTLYRRPETGNIYYIP